MCIDPPGRLSNGPKKFFDVCEVIKEEGVVQDLMHEIGYPATRITLVSELDVGVDERDEVIELEIVWVDLYGQKQERVASERAMYRNHLGIPGKSVVGVKSSRTCCVST